MNHADAVAKAVKFLRLAQSDNAHEAALAAARAQEIIDRYKLVGIEEALTSDADSEPEPDEPIQDFNHAPMQSGSPAGRSDKWRNYLMWHVCNANQCRYWIRNGSLFVIVGRPSDAETVRYIFDMLVREVECISEAAGKGCGKTWRNNFRLGMVDEIGARLKAQTEATQQKLRGEALGIGGGAIVRVDKAIARFKSKSAETDAFYERLRKARGIRKGSASRVNHDGDAREAGRKAGREVQLGGAKAGLGAGRKALGQ